MSETFPNGTFAKHYGRMTLILLAHGGQSMLIGMPIYDGVISSMSPARMRCSPGPIWM
jgi:hypothetical protein